MISSHLGLVSFQLTREDIAVFHSIVGLDAGLISDESSLSFYNQDYMKKYRLLFS